MVTLEFVLLCVIVTDELFVAGPRPWSSSCHRSRCCSRYRRCWTPSRCRRRRPSTWRRRHHRPWRDRHRRGRRDLADGAELRGVVDLQVAAAVRLGRPRRCPPGPPPSGGPWTSPWPWRRRPGHVTSWSARRRRRRRTSCPASASTATVEALLAAAAPCRHRVAARRRCSMRPLQRSRPAHPHRCRRGHRRSRPGSGHRVRAGRECVGIGVAAVRCCQRVLSMMACLGRGVDLDVAARVRDGPIHRPRCWPTSLGPRCRVRPRRASSAGSAPFWADAANGMANAPAAASAPTPRQLRALCVTEYLHRCVDDTPTPEPGLLHPQIVPIRRLRLFTPPLTTCQRISPRFPAICLRSPPVRQDDARRPRRALRRPRSGLRRCGRDRRRTPSFVHEDLHHARLRRRPRPLRPQGS